MKRIAATPIALFLILGAGATVVLFGPVRSVAQKPGVRKAVIVELFTSEGCSSCPPADQFFSRIAGQKVNGAEIIPLGFHVDYWDGQGWRDRFSSSEYTHRQQWYAERLKLDGPYTPQMVVDGTRQFVGNQTEDARVTITEAAAQPQQSEVDLSPAKNGAIRVRVTGSGAGDVLLAITEDNLSSQVIGGENQGHELRHSAVVRHFERLGELHDGSFDSTIPLKLKKDWKLQDLHVVAFVQQPATGKILGAARIETRLLSAAR